MQLQNVSLNGIDPEIYHLIETQEPWKFSKLGLLQYGSCCNIFTHSHMLAHINFIIFFRGGGSGSAAPET